MRRATYVGVALLTFTLGGIVYYLTTLKHAAPPVPASKPFEQKAEVKPPPVPLNVSIILRTNLEEAEKPEFKYRTLKLSDKPVIVDDLDVPEYVDGQEITILGGDQSTKFWVSERYRTSMTVMGEGPHLDLVDWRHFDSEWIPLERISERKFRTLARERMKDEKFPATNQAELIAAVRKRAGDWPEAIDLAKACSGPKAYPCAVGVSSVYFRVEMLVGDQWTTVGNVEVSIPMGC
jgi:hypothetical protein